MEFGAAEIGAAMTAAVAIIPARGGSKRLPRKNLRLVGGKPLIVHAVASALSAACIREVHVSTEDPEIARIARQHGGQVIDRPAELAADTAQNDAVVRHALETVGAGRFDLVVLLQPTSPLRLGEHIDACVEGMLRHRARSALTVTAVDVHPGKTLILRDGMVHPFTTAADMEARHQDMAEVHRQNGAVYALGVGDFLEHGRFFLPPCYGSLMSREESIDIDDELDLALADLLYQRRPAAIRAENGVSP